MIIYYDESVINHNSYQQGTIYIIPNIHYFINGYSKQKQNNKNLNYCL